MNNNITLFVTLNAKKVTIWAEKETSGPSEGDVGPFWASSASRKQNVGPSRAPASFHMCQMIPTHCHMLQKTSSCLRWRPVHQNQSSHLQWVIPPMSGSAKVSLVRTSFLFLVQWLITTLSYLCHPNNHMMGSSAPWRSELIISPCVPIHWYLSVGCGPAHQELRPPWAHQSSGS